MLKWLTKRTGREKNIPVTNVVTPITSDFITMENEI